MGELWEAAVWEGMGVGETKEEAKVEKWLQWRGAKGVGMVEAVEKAGPRSPTVSPRRRLRRGRGHLARPGAEARNGSTWAGLPAGTAIRVQDARAAECGLQVGLVGSRAAP